MSNYNVTRIKHATLSGTAVDNVTLSEEYLVAVEVLNRGTADMSVSTGVDGAASPVLTSVPQDEAVLVLGNSRVVIPLSAPGSATVTVSLKGNSNAYSVTGLVR